MNDYLNELGEAEKDALVDSLIECYDVNGDDYLSRDEFDTYVVDSLLGREGACPSANATQRGPVSMAITRADVQTLYNWTGGRRMYQIYAATHNTFNKEAWRAAISGKNNLVFIARTLSGKVVGGFTGDAYIPLYETSQWLTSPDSFVFNLKSEPKTKWNHSYSSSNIWINTYS